MLQGRRRSCAGQAVQAPVALGSGREAAVRKARCHWVGLRLATAQQIMTEHSYAFLPVAPLARRPFGLPGLPDSVRPATPLRRRADGAGPLAASAAAALGAPSTPVHVGPGRDGFLAIGPPASGRRFLRFAPKAMHLSPLEDRSHCERLALEREKALIDRTRYAEKGSRECETVVSLHGIPPQPGRPHERRNATQGRGARQTQSHFNPRFNSQRSAAAAVEARKTIRTRRRRTRRVR